MSTTNVVTNADGTVAVYISTDHIAVVPLLWPAALVLALVIGVGWVVAKKRKPKAS